MTTIRFGPPGPEDQVRFLANVERLLTETQPVTSYRYALLLALADLAVERGWDQGTSPTLEITAIADKVATYYWRQVRPLAGGDGREGPESVLRQSVGAQAKVVTLLQHEHARHRGSLASLRRDPKYDVLVRKIAAVLSERALWTLQRVGTRGEEELDFLFPNKEGGTTIELRNGVAFTLRRFHGFVSDAVRASWLRFVRDLEDNAAVLGATKDLEEWMFGSRREGPVDPGVLASLQADRCFYCDRPLRDQVVQADRFVPWSRYRLDLAHNFVATHRKCRHAKGDRLAATEHLARWIDRNRTQAPALATAFDQATLVHDVEASARVVAWAYAHAEATGAKVWVRGEDLETLAPTWRELFGR